MANGTNLVDPSTVKEHIVNVRTESIAFVVAVFSLVLGGQVYAACATTQTVPGCVETTTSSEDPGFDLTNRCGHYAVTLNVTAPDVDFTFNLSDGESMSSEILSEIPRGDLEALTNAHADGAVSVMCCPDFSSRTHCQSPLE